jgi:hypothetical protein
MLRGKSIDDIINKWTIDLDTHVQAFERYAVEIAAWDRALLQNANDVNKPSSSWSLILIFFFEIDTAGHTLQPRSGG